MTHPIQAYLADLLPSTEKYESLQLNTGDTLIHAPGFEDRTMGFPECLSASPTAHAILLNYIPFNTNNRLQDVRDALLSRGVSVVGDDVLEYNRFNPGDFTARLGARLSYLHTRRAVIDISTMSKLAIMLILSVCRTLDLYVSILYCEPEEYGPTEEDFIKAKKQNRIHRPSLQIYTGVHGVVRVDSLASVAMQGQPTAALVFMSLNDALTQCLLNTVYPSRLFLINGRPPVHLWREEATAWIHDQVRREWEEDNPVRLRLDGHIALPIRSVSTFDYRETVSLLLQLYWDLSSNYRILLAPAGSKMQAVGSYLVKALHPDIHIEYPSPEGFKPVLSKKLGPRWILDLSQLSTRLTDISASERRKYLEIQV